MSEDELIKRAVNARNFSIQMARKSSAFFAAYVMKDDITGKKFKNSQMHKDWHDFLNKNRRAVLWASVETGKTSSCTIARALWLLGNNPTTRIVIVSETIGQSKKILRAIAKNIEENADVHAVFPDLKPGDVWSSTSLVVSGARATTKDPSVQCIGVGSGILGARVDHLMLDDVLSYENTKTQSRRDELWNWFHSTLAGRMTKDGVIQVVGTAFHPDDILHRLGELPGWAYKKFPLINLKGESAWPEAWPLDRIAEKRKSITPIEFARQHLCEARDDTEAIFKQEWIDLCLKEGNGEKLHQSIPMVPDGCKVFTGVDLAVQRGDAHDRTALFTILLHPNGDRQILNIESGKWHGPQIISRMISAHQRYHSILVVENNQGQDYLLQFARQQNVVLPIIPFTTGRQKAHPEFGFQSLAAEMAQGRWIIPNENGVTSPEVSAWLGELLYYDPMGHTGDRAMAGYFAREGCRRGETKRGGGVGMRVIG